MNRTCEAIRDMLVDYADDELSTADAQVVAEHLAECLTCHETVQGLQRSLHLAKAIWQDNLGARAVHRRVARRLCYAGIAASILIAAGVLLLNTVNRPTNLDATYAQIEQQVTQAGAAARLLAATQILATCEGTESIVERQHRYILSRYADTPAAAAIRTANPSIPGVTEND